MSITRYNMRPDSRIGRKNEKIVATKTIKTQVAVFLAVGSDGSDCNMYTCSGNCIQERSAGFPMFSFITLLTLISLIVLQPRSYIKAR